MDTNTRKRQEKKKGTATHTTDDHVFDVREMNQDHPGLNPNLPQPVQTAVWDPRFSWAHRETRNTHLVPPGVCGSWPLLAVWDPRFSWAHRQPTTLMWSLLECAAPGRSSQYGTRGFLGLTAKPQLP